MRIPDIRLIDRTVLEVKNLKDLDVFVEASEENARKLMQAFIEFGLGSSVTESLLLEEGNF